jgi:hypothetical protein
MGNFSDRLSADDSLAVREYIVARANELLNVPPRTGGPGAGGAAAAPTQQSAPRAEGEDDVHQEAAEE